MNNLKTIGIGVDNYKIEKFKAALAEAGFDDIEIVKFVGKTSIMKVKNVPSERIHDVHKICTKLQLDFNRSN